MFFFYFFSQPGYIIVGSGVTLWKGESRVESVDKEAEYPPKHPPSLPLSLFSRRFRFQRFGKHRVRDLSIVYCYLVCSFR